MRALQAAVALMPDKKARNLGELADEYHDPNVKKTASFWASHTIVLLWPTSIIDAVVRCCTVHQQGFR